MTSLPIIARSTFAVGVRVKSITLDGHDVDLTRCTAVEPSIGWVEMLTTDVSGRFVFDAHNEIARHRVYGEVKVEMK